MPQQEHIQPRELFMNRRGFLLSWMGGEKLLKHFVQGVICRLDFKERPIKLEIDRGWTVEQYRRGGVLADRRDGLLVEVADCEIREIVRGEGDEKGGRAKPEKLLDFCTPGRMRLSPKSRSLRRTLRRWPIFPVAKSIFTLRAWTRDKFFRSFCRASIKCICVFASLWKAASNLVTAKCNLIGLTWSRHYCVREIEET